MHYSARYLIRSAVLTLAGLLTIGGLTVCGSPQHEAAPVSEPSNVTGQIPEIPTPPSTLDAMPTISVAAGLKMIASGPGFSSSYNLNHHTYTIHLVASPRVEQYRATIISVATEINRAGFASISVPGGQVASAPVRPAAGQIYFNTNPSSPCGVTNLAGCTREFPAYRATTASIIDNGASVYILPVTDRYSAANKRHVVAHEIGHALGLNHYAAAYGGRAQLMHPSSYAFSTFQAGDWNGLAALNHNTAPTGGITTLTGADGNVHVVGYGYDPDQIDAATIEVTVNGKDIFHGIANRYNAGVQKALHPYGNVGFDIVVKAAPGRDQVCEYVVNYPAVSSVKLGCNAVVVTAAVAGDDTGSGSGASPTASADPGR